MLKKIFESTELKQAKSELKIINTFEEQLQTLSDEDLRAKTPEFKRRLEEGESLGDIRPEVFAVVREAAKRVTGKRLYDVQILGGLILDYGSVAEMRTGEGKTLTSLAPVYLNALSGEGVMVSTVNEYLTERDAVEMGEVHNWLGLTVGINKRSLSKDEKREAYHCDITYSVHSEIGFDYLRDNMVQKFEEKVQRSFNFALIDEVDSILIDEARTPLIISGGSDESEQTYIAADQFAKSLTKEDYDIDWESKSIQLNTKGIDKANKFFGLDNIFQVQHSSMVNRVHNALWANYIMNKDADYIIREDKIMIVDAFTGRVMEGRSYAEGRHQAIQAKERVEIEPETKTMATITYQNLFRMFKKLSGMSGTAKTEENEFIEIYNMRVHEIPTNKPVIRIDHPDWIFSSAKAKYKAIIEDIIARYKKGQPVLVGTEEVSESEKISRMLNDKNIPHTVLNAKQNGTEAEIIAGAGNEKAVTIATNMAGRGTDIKPTPKSLELGGLYVLGTNKAESRRIDNQLKGRSGRQGDIGESRFYLSIEDNLMSRFSNFDKIKKMFGDMGDKPIKGKAIYKAFNRAQIKIEGFNFDTRKNVLQYDDVIRLQRDLIYKQRDMIISQEDLIVVIQRMMKSVVKEAIADFQNFKKQDGSLDVEKMSNVLNKVWFNLTKFKLKPETLTGKMPEEIIEVIAKDLLEAYDQLRDNITDGLSESGLHDVERSILLQTFDNNWQVHIDQMTKLRSSSSLVSYAQQNPYQVFVEKGTELFNDLLKRISHNTVKLLMNNRYAIVQEDPFLSDIKLQVESFLNKNSKNESEK